MLKLTKKEEISWDYYIIQSSLVIGVSEWREDVVFGPFPCSLELSAENKSAEGYARDTFANSGKLISSGKFMLLSL